MQILLPLQYNYYYCVIVITMKIRNLCKNKFLVNIERKISAKLLNSMHTMSIVHAFERPNKTHPHRKIKINLAIPCTTILSNKEKKNHTFGLFGYRANGIE